jgi:two-component system, cell cycle sensor histidine kinase and response regulator CckA
MTGANKVSPVVRKRSRKSAPAASSLDHTITGSDLVGTVVGWNKGARDLYGYTAEEMMGQSVAIVIPEHLREEGLQSLLEVFGQPVPADNETVRKREQEILVQISLMVSPVRNSKGDIIGASTIAHATGQRKRREECERLAAVVESSDDAIIGQSLDGTIFAWNPGAERLFGYSASEAFGKQIRMLLPPERADEESAILARIKRGERVDHFETVRVKKEGGNVHVSVTISPIRNSQGEIVGASKIARDITARKQAEDEFSRSRQELEDKTLMLQSVLDSISEGLVATDAEGKFVLWNPAAKAIVRRGALNLRKEEWAERYGLFLPDKVTPFPLEQNPLARAIQGEASTAVMFVRHAALADGIFLEANASPLKDKHGAVYGGVTAFRDITERMRSEDRLREYERVVESLVDMIVVVDKNYRYVIANRAFLNYREMEKEQVIGRRMDEVLKKEVFDSIVKEKVDECFRGKVLQYELTYNYPNLGERALFASYFPVPGPTGIDRIVCVLRDITDRKRAEEARERLAAVVESSDDAIIGKSLDGTIFAWNSGAENLFGYTAAEALGQSIQMLVPPERASEEPDILARIKRGSRLEHFETVRVQKDGKRIDVSVTISPIRDGSGTIIGASKIARDISERKCAEEELRKAEERFGKAFRSNPLAVSISTQAEGRYLDVNDAFLKILGYTREDVIGRTASGLSFWVQSAQREQMLTLLEENGHVTELRTQYKTSTGELREAEVSAEMIELEGQPCVLAITRDITETVRLEAQFRQAQKMEAVGRLAGGVAHDFNNMLSVIIGYSDLSADLVAADSPLKKHLAQIKKASERAALLTRQLLAFSRQQVIFPRILDLNGVVENLSTMLLRMIGENISLSFKPTTPIGSIKADPGQIEQILMNLVVNARDAMPGGGQIIIETGHAELDEHYVSQNPGSRTGEHVVLAVCDTGSGMDDDIKSKIFEPFFTTKGLGQGTGLGLSTVYGIVTQSAGSISVDSQPGKGTTFKIYFPRVAARAEHVQESHDVKDLPPGSETILVVDDDDGVRKVTASLLSNAGYRVIEANSAEKAMEIITGSGPGIDLLLTDLVMFGRSGLELFEQAKVLRPSLRSLFMSGYTGDLVDLESGLISERAFLAKPFARLPLLTKVYAVLHGK